MHAQLYSAPPARGGLAYEAPVVRLEAVESHEENQPAWFVVPIAMVAWFGGMWAWCKLMCLNNGGVKSCETQYVVNVKAVCKK